MAALGDIIDLKCAQISVSQENNELIKKFSLIKIAISSPETGSQFIVKFFVAALRTVLFLTTERSYIFVHPHSCLERLYILHRRCVQHNSHDEAIFISTGTVQNTAPESEFLILSMTPILLLVIICAPRRIFTLQLFTKWFESHCIPALMMYLLFMFTFFRWTYCLLEPLSGHIFSRKIVFYLSSNSRKLLSENDVDAILCWTGRGGM